MPAVFFLVSRGCGQDARSLFLFMINGGKMILNRFPDKDCYLRLAKSYKVVPVCIKVLADMLTPVSLLERFYEGRGPIFLFESVEGGERWARYSFLGFSAHALVKVFVDSVEIEESGNLRSIPHSGNPLKVLREFLTPYRSPEISDLPRFWGGLVGHLNYEMASFIEAVPHRWPSEQPLACFMIPENVLIFDNIRHSLTLTVLTFPKGNPVAEWAVADERLQSLLETIEAPMPRLPAAEMSGIQLATGVSADDFRRQVAIVKDHIRAGDVIQTVISQPFLGELAPDPRLLYRAMRHKIGRASCRERV